MATKKFPEMIYVTRENEGTKDDYLVAYEGGVEHRDFDENTPVAIYKLVEVGEVVVTRTFTSKQKRPR